MGRIKKTALLVVILLTASSGSAQLFRFMNRQGKPVPCKVKLRKQGNFINNLSTDAQGFIDLSLYCNEPGIEIVFTPFNPTYPGEEILCLGGNNKVEVLKFGELASLERNSQLDTSKSKRYLAIAALSTNQLTARKRSLGQESAADSLEAVTYALTASYFNIPYDEAVYQDPLQEDKIVAKEILLDTIKEFQSASGLPADGVIGWKTLSEMANARPAWLYSNTEWKTQ